MFCWRLKSGGNPLDAEDIFSIQNILRNGNASSAVAFRVAGPNFVFQRSTAPIDTFYDHASGYHLCYWGRIDNLSELTQTSECSANSKHPAELLMSAWLMFGNQIAGKLAGEFAISLINTATQHAVLFRDALGMRPLFYSIQGDSLSGASSIACLLNIPNAHYEKNFEWIKKFLFSKSLASMSADCPYVGIRRVPPAHVLEFKEGKLVSSTRFARWNDPDVSGKKCDPAYVQKHRALLNKAIAKRVPESEPIAIESSGGLDSSSILTLLGENHSNALITLSTYCIDYEKMIIEHCDERAGVLKHYSCPITYLDAENVAKREVSVLGHPSSQGIELEFDILEKARLETGISRLFSGFGGDQFVTNFGEDRLRELVHKKQFLQLWKVLPGRTILKPWRIVKTLLKRGYLRDPETWVEELVKNLKNNTILASDLEGTESLASEILADQHRKFRQSSINQAIINYHLNDEHIQNRFTCHGLIMDSFGLQMEWPLCDHELIQNYLDTPNIEKLGKGFSRRFLHVRAVKDLLPSELFSTKEKAGAKYLETPNQADETRIFWSQRTQNLVQNLHPDIVPVVRTNRLIELQKRSLENMGKTTTQSDHAFIDAASALYSLDIWFKHGK